MTGVRTNNVASTAVSDEIVVNRNGSTALQDVRDLATQLASAGAIATRIDQVYASAAAGQQWKSPVRVAASGNIDSAGLVAGATIDGILLVAGDRVLLLGQSDPSRNGIYVAQASIGAPRAADADVASELVGMAVFVRQGAVNGGKQFVCVTPAPITIGTTAINYQVASDQVALNANLSGEITKRAAMIDEMDYSGGLDFVDESGFIAARLADDGGFHLNSSSFTIGEHALDIVDEAGWSIMRVTTDGTQIGGLTGLPGGSVAWDDTPIITGPLIQVAGFRTSLYLRNIMPIRSDDSKVRGTIVSLGSLDGSRQTSMQTGDDQLTFDLQTMGSTVTLMTRVSDGDPSARKIIRDMAAIVAPRPAPAANPIKLLMIGDSITNRQMAAFVRAKLTGWGYAPTMIGTINGVTAGSNDALNAGGPLNEGREGWEFGDFTYAVTDRVSPVAAGQEVAYLAMDKASKWPVNPFIRASTGSDSASIIRNGMVFDFANYLTRFSLQTPDVVFIGLMTNDIRDRSTSDLVASVIDGATIMRNQIRGASSTCRIVFWTPPAARSADRDGLWANSYVPVIQALIKFQRELGDTRTLVAPTWAMANQEFARTYSNTVADPDTGILAGSVTDPIHFGDETRHQVSDVLASWAAAVAAGLI